MVDGSTCASEVSMIKLLELKAQEDIMHWIKSLSLSLFHHNDIIVYVPPDAF